MFGANIFSGAERSMTTFISRTTNIVATSLGCPSLSMLGLSFSKIYRLFKKNKDVVSQEIKDFSLQTSTYNKIIPEVFGKVVVAGNIIWVSEITKTNIYHSQKITKNGIQSAYSEKLIRGNFAIVICKGEIDEVKNIYANNEPLNLSLYNIKIYNGSEQQKPDVTMQSYLGEDIPAFRGLCYAVFTDFPLEEFNGTIPNFTFEVIRNKELQEQYDMEKLVSCINIIPGTGEFVYDTQIQKKLNGNYINETFYETGKPTIINKHNLSNNTDAVESLNNLQATFPNLKWVSVVVCWFCDDLDCGKISIYPACENNNSITKPDTWEVAGKTRQTAKLVGKDSNGNIRYGGTPSDECVKRYIKEIKKRGLNVCIYPMLMVDIDKKPWRGHITGSSNDIHDFFIKQDGYNNFVKHYANLLKNDVDAIIIGSEMVGLTSIIDEINNTYPAVDEFCNLANDIRQIVNSNTKITYTADWSEYHHNHIGDYNLDKLWANNNIDFIGIDAYFPLTDKDLTTYNIEEIKNGWKNGEGYEFYYKDKERTKKESLKPEYAWKNIEWFWKNYHYDKNGNKTEWIPKSKKIWFMEYGFPSVDCCTNQPNVFYSKDSIDGAFPRHSKGCVDFKAQRVAIISTELAFNDSEFVENKFLYTWDARPYPCFPNLKDIWADSYCWKYGHFLNGKTGYSTLGNIIKYICKNVGLKDSDFDVSLIKDDIVDGFIMNDNKTALNYLKILAITFNFDAYIDNGKIIFKSLKNTEVHNINEDDIIIDENTGKVAFLINHLSETTIPNEIELLFLNIENDYKTSTVIAKDNSNENKVYGVMVDVPMSVSQANDIAWRLLSNLSNQNTTYTFKLPITYLNISPLDIIKITYQNEEYIIRVKSIKIVDLITLEIIGFSTAINENMQLNLAVQQDDYIKQKNIITDLAETDFDIIELYNIYNDVKRDKIILHVPIWSEMNNWCGASIYYSIDNEKNYEAFKYIDKETSIGQLVDINHQTICSNYLDKCSSIIFTLLNEDGKLHSITDEEFLNLKNIILVGNEIIAFRDVEQIDNNVFKVSYLLRGRFNTDNYINNHNIGERVILLDNDLIRLELPITMINKNIFIKAVSKGNSLLNAKTKIITPIGKYIIDFNIKNLCKYSMKNGDIKLVFYPRKNYKINNLNVDINGKFLLKIFDKRNNLMRKVKIENQNSFLYNLQLQMEDFGRKISQNDINFEVESIVSIS